MSNVVQDETPTTVNIYPNISLESPQSVQTTPEIPGQPQSSTAIWKKISADKKKNKPQVKSVKAASPLLVTGGMNITWSFGISATTDPFFDSTFVRVCWFLAAIMGTYVGAALTRRVPSAIFVLVSIFMVIIGGALFWNFPYDFIAIMMARQLNGFAVGLVIVPTMMMAGEESVPHVRGKIASSAEAQAFSIGVLIQVLITELSSILSFPVNVHSLVCVACSLIAYKLHFDIIESPVQLLLSGQEQEALDCLRRLQRPFTLTAETSEQLEEHKLYIADSKAKIPKHSAINAFKLSLLRCIVGLNFALVVKAALGDKPMNLASSAPASNADKLRYIFMMPLMGAYLGSNIVDTAGRKWPLIFGSLGCGVTALSIGYMQREGESVLHTYAVALFFLMFFYGLNCCSTSAYLSEAFPLATKRYSIAAVLAVEMFVYMIIAALPLSSFQPNTSFQTLGYLTLLLALFISRCLPETKSTTLREAQEKFEEWKCCTCL